MDQFFVEHLGEIILGGAIGVFGWAFKSWSNSLKNTSTMILDKLDYLTKEFHAHRVEVERRVTKVETKVDLLTQKPVHFDLVDARSVDE